MLLLFNLESFIDLEAKIISLYSVVLKSMETYESLVIEDTTDRFFS